MSNSYNSFYGGRRGASFVIVKRYNSINEMINCFQQGGDYKTVNYDEYVLIDTMSKNNVDNGKIYRRGYDYTNEVGGAIYIGQIVGPAGMGPHLEIKTIDEVKEIQQEEDFEYRRGEGEYNTTESLIPGKYVDDAGSDQFNDEIKWAYCSVRDKDAHETTAYIGFTIPYSVIDFIATSVSPYYNRDGAGAGFVNTNLVKRTDDQSHPFFEKWDISIPKGIKGDTFKNFRVMVADESIQDYPNKEDDISNERKVLVYDYYQYDDVEDSKPTVIYIGEYNIIEDVTFDDNGTVTIKYTHNDDTIYNKKIKWLTEVSINIGDTEGKGNQKIHLKYNTDEEVDIGNPINYIMKTAIDKGHLLCLYSDPAKREEIKSQKKNYTYDGRDDWYDLGVVISNTGLLSGKYYDKTKYPGLDTIEHVIAFLNDQYPNGLTEPDLVGKMVSVGLGEEDKEIYAFDYTTTDGKYAGWYFLGKLSTQVVSNVVAKENDPNIQTLLDSLPVNGIWFVEEE